jgi:hypothetical protein
MRMTGNISGFVHRKARGNLHGRYQNANKVILIRRRPLGGGVHVKNTSGKYLLSLNM